MQLYRISGKDDLMAQPMMCDFCDGAEPALMLVTNTNNGDVMGLGQDCIAPWAGALMASFTPEEPVPHTPSEPGDPGDEDDDEPGGGHLISSTAVDESVDNGSSFVCHDCDYTVGDIDAITAERLSNHHAVGNHHITPANMNAHAAPSTTDADRPPIDEPAAAPS